MTEIAIIGTGDMARELGIAFVAAEHTVRYGSRRPEASDATAKRLPAGEVRSQQEAIADAEVVVIAIPYPQVASFVSAHADALRGKVIVDISNPFDNLSDNARAGVEYTADALGTRDGLVAAFKDNFWATINEPADADTHRRHDVKIAGDDEEAKRVVARLVEDIGHRPLDCGELANARLIDPMVSLMLILDRRYNEFKMTTGWTFFGLGR